MFVNRGVHYLILYGVVHMLDSTVFPHQVCGFSTK